MNPNMILYPMFAMFLLVAIVLVRLGTLRLGAINRREVRAKYYRHYLQDGSETDEMVFTSRNFINLFEMPVLFFTISILIYVTNSVDLFFVVLAWIYVAGRYLHTLLHVTSNVVQRRFFVYNSTNVLLLLMWGKLLYDLILTGGGGI